MGDPLKSRLLEVILLLVGLSLYTPALNLVYYVIPLHSEYGRILTEIFPWLGRAIFALVLLPQAWRISPKIAVAIGFLCLLEPVYGGIFYLIVTTAFQFKLNEWFIDLLD